MPTGLGEPALSSRMNGAKARVFKGITGWRSRKQSWQDQMNPVTKDEKSSLSGSEKRRKRKGGNPKGGPGQRGGRGKRVR